MIKGRIKQTSKIVIQLGSVALLRCTRTENEAVLIFFVGVLLTFTALFLKKFETGEPLHAQDLS